MDGLEFSVKEKVTMKQILEVTETEKNFGESRRQHGETKKLEGKKNIPEREEEKGRGINSKIETMIYHKPPGIIGSNSQQHFTSPAAAITHPPPFFS